MRYLVVWSVLATPASVWCYQLLVQGRSIAEHLLNPSGALSAILLIFALLATPLRCARPRAKVAIWLVRNRRYLGVASFGYALLHTVIYAVDAGSVAKIMAEIPRLDIWTGWVSLLIMAPLAATSTDAAVRLMGPRWKALQRWCYGAAILGFLHALSLNNWEDIWEPLIISAPLIALQLMRLRRSILRALTRRSKAA